MEGAEDKKNFTSILRLLQYLHLLLLLLFAYRRRYLVLSPPLTQSFLGESCFCGEEGNTTPPKNDWGEATSNRLMNKRAQIPLASIDFQLTTWCLEQYLPGLFGKLHFISV